jgi:hypothetical protein
MKTSRYIMPLAFVAVFAGLAFATAPASTSGITSGLCQLKALIVGIIPTLALMMFLLAGLAYAAGQVFGAETKAKAQGWAMSLLVGGIIGIIIAVLAPFLVDIFIGMGLSGSRAC